MTRGEFTRRYHALDATAVDVMFAVFLAARDVPGVRGQIVSALDLVEDQVEAIQFGARRQACPPPPVAVPVVHPVS